MPGTAADPVRLDPFQRITEVHWPAGFMVAVAIDIEFDDTEVTHTQAKIPQLSMNYGGSDPDAFANWIVIDDNPTDQTVTSQSAFSAGYLGGVEAIALARVWSIRDEEWQIPAFTPAVTGLPSIAPTGSIGPWVGYATDTRWDSSFGGSGFGLSVPDRPDIPFGGSVSPHIVVEVGVEGDGTTPDWYYFGPSPGTVTSFKLTTPGASGTETPIDAAIAFSGLRVLHEGKTYRPTATAVEDDTRLWILCIRE